MKKLFIQFPVLLFLIHCILTTAQSPAAAPAPPGPPNVTAILEKDGRFTIFIKLLQSTKVADNLNSQLNDSNQGLTLFAPPDSAFSSLKVGMLNSLLPTSVAVRDSKQSSKHTSWGQLATLPPPPPSPPPPKKAAPKDSPAYSVPVDSSSAKCLSRRVIHAMICVLLALAAVS